MIAEYPGAIAYFVDRSRVFANQNSHNAIVCHCTGGNPDQAVEELGDWYASADNTGMVSSHFGIDRDGRIAQYVLLQDGAAANCCLEDEHNPFWDQFGKDNLNWRTVSIECVNDEENSLPLTEPQKMALFGLVKWLCDLYGLGADQVMTHKSIAPQSRPFCPGSAYPLDELRAFLTNGGNTMAPTGWKIGGEFLVAPNNMKVHGLIKNFVMDNAWNPDNVPLTAEEQTGPVTWIQYFRDCKVICDQGKTFYGPIGQELLDARAKATALQAQLSSNQLATDVKALLKLADDIKAQVGP
jgi:N-acetylmuramoyl-L-alanine amidase